MAMEERQTQIREGAGLEEGRLNTEFIDLMKKWGPHLLMVLAVLALAYLGYDKYTKWQASKQDNAFSELNTAASAGNPDNLAAVARDNSGAGAVPLEANLYAADLHMSASRTGVPIGAKFNDPPKDTNLLADDKPFLTDDQKKEELGKAESLYKTVVDTADSSVGQSLLAIGALNGLASVAEDRGELDKAKSFYQQAMSKASEAKFDKLEKLIKARIDSVDTLKTAPKLFAAGELPGAPDKVVTTPLGGVTAKTADGGTLTIGSDGKITPGGAATPQGTTPITLPNGGSLNLTPSNPPTTPAPAPTSPPAADPSKPATP